MQSIIQLVTWVNKIINTMNNGWALRHWNVGHFYKFCANCGAVEENDRLIRRFDCSFFSASNAVKLYNHLFGNYSPVRPVTEWDETVNIQLTFSLYQIKALVSDTEFFMPTIQCHNYIIHISHIIHRLPFSIMETLSRYVCVCVCVYFWLDGHCSEGQYSCSERVCLIRALNTPN